MLAKDPADRYQSCDELNADLKKHPLAIQDGQLKLRPAPWAGANASNPTVVGAPTPLTPGVSAARVDAAAAWCPREVPGQTPTQAQSVNRITAEVAVPAPREQSHPQPAGRGRRGDARRRRLDGLQGPPAGRGQAAEAVAVAAVPTPPPAPAVPALAPTAVDAATGLPADPARARSTVRSSPGSPPALARSTPRWAMSPSPTCAMAMAVRTSRHATASASAP